MKNLFKTLLCTMLLAAFANAQALPWERLHLTGEARLKVLFWNVYDARLFTADGSYAEDRYPVALQLNYLRDIDKGDLVDETRNQWRQQGLDGHPRIETWLAELTDLWKDVRKNDAITLVVDSAGRSSFYFNDELLGYISDPDFAGYFTAIWLSENTTSPRVREQLINGGRNES